MEELLMEKKIVFSDEQQKNLKNSREAENYMGLCRGYLGYLRSAGRGPAFLKNGKHILYTAESLAAWMKERNTFVETPQAVKAKK